MSRAGYLLAGGASSRMGTDKALLPFRGRTLAQHIAGEMVSVAESVTLVGDPDRYTGLGLRVIPDAVEACGPVGGIYTALRDTTADWNLVVACDMPGLKARFLAELFAAAERDGGLCLAPTSPSGRVEPLCAVYHRDALARVQEALDRGLRRARDLPGVLGAHLWPVEEGSWFANMNTPEEWSAHINEQ